MKVGYVRVSKAIQAVESDALNQLHASEKQDAR